MSKTQPSAQWGILACPPKVPIQERALLTMGEAERIEMLFKTLANSTRLRLLHALVRNSEMRVTELAEAIAMKPQAVSNQLQRLTDRGILGSRREGTQIFYRIIDPCIVSILEYGLCLSEDAQERIS